MVLSDPATQQVIIGIAHALFINRLHLLRLTEVVRLHIEPDKEDGAMEVPPELDQELKQQAIDYVLTCFPDGYRVLISQVSSDWLQPA